MNLKELAIDYIRRAEVRLNAAKRAIDSKDYPDAVRFSQECVEFSIKAALRLYGIEYPKEHDVGRILRAVRKRFPEWFEVQIDKIAEISSDLASKRSASMYGLEIAGKPPSQIFGKDEALSAFKDSEFVFNLIKKFFKDISANK